jgi:hypothetical protein
MTNDRKQLLQEKINAAFKALNELSALVTEEDMEWASDAYDKDMSDADEELAMGLINIADSLREMSYAFEM